MCVKNAHYIDTLLNIIVKIKSLILAQIYYFQKFFYLVWNAKPINLF